jgi:hypothetical protein
MKTDANKGNQYIRPVAERTGWSAELETATQRLCARINDYEVALLGGGTKHPNGMTILSSGEAVLKAIEGFTQTHEECLNLYEQILPNLTDVGQNLFFQAFVYNHELHPKNLDIWEQEAKKAHEEWLKDPSILNKIVAKRFDNISREMLNEARLIAGVPEGISTREYAQEFMSGRRK